MPFLIFLAWLCVLLPGCEVAPEPGSRHLFTYTIDNQTREVLEQLKVQGAEPGTSQFGRTFIGLFVPEKFLPYEPFVLAQVYHDKKNK